MKKIIVAIDSFKGCMSSTEAVRAATEGIHRVWPSAQVLQIPVSDGGEGLLDSILTAKGGTIIHLLAHDPLMRLVPTRYGVLNDRQTAVIEMAEINGLTMLKVDERNPMQTSSYGTGKLISDALKRGYRRIIIGLGGSATCDGGLGMLQALGIQFYDCRGHQIGQGGQAMATVATIRYDRMTPALQSAELIIACDVDNPFDGPQGAAYVFAPQKGASPEEVRLLDDGLHHLAGLIRLTTQTDLSTLPGAGAAGGIGGALAAFTRCSMQSGIDLFLDTVGFTGLLENTDLLITGEGKADRQTLHGKVPMGILKRGQAHHIPTLLITGAIDPDCIDELNAAGFRAVYSITPCPLSLEQAMDTTAAKKNLCHLLTQICRTISI